VVLADVGPEEEVATGLAVSLPELDAAVLEAGELPVALEAAGAEVAPDEAVEAAEEATGLASLEAVVPEEAAG
jgi:hypothetical protein